MAILALRKYPDQCLLRTSQPVDSISQNEIKLISDMVETMYANKGMGLAAPQVGVNKRVAVVDAGEGLLKLINPEIVERTGQDMFEEACLSVPQINVKISRAKKVKIEALDQNGRKIEKEFTGLTAKAIQQEIDHLNGKLILDYLPWYKKNLMKLWLKAKAKRRKA